MKKFSIRWEVRWTNTRTGHNGITSRYTRREARDVMKLLKGSIRGQASENINVRMYRVTEVEYPDGVICTYQARAR